MRDRFPGYYRPNTKEFNNLWRDGLVIPDANVLLTLYRVGDGTRTRLLEIFKAFEDRLFLSYQAGFEFQKNRLGTIYAQTAAYEEVLEGLRSFPEKLGHNLREHPRLESRDLEDQVTKALEPIVTSVTEIRDSHPDPIREDAIGSDTVRDVLDEVFAGKVGPRRDLAEVAKEGALRYEHRQPPGYEDRNKGDDSQYGDLAIWLDSIDAAKRHSKDVIFVTADRKEDWWWIREGERISARPELVAEMKEVAGQKVYLYDIKRFMEEASKFLELGEVSEDERQDVARAQEAGASSLEYLSDHDDFRVSEDSWKRYADHLLQTLRSEEIESPQRSIEFPAGEFRWHSSVSQQETSTELSLMLHPRLFSAGRRSERQQFTCVVTGPYSGESAAVIVTTDRDEITVRYPTDFQGAREVKEGQYRYDWWVTGSNLGFLVPQGNVASGTFDLGGALRDASSGS